MRGDLEAPDYLPFIDPFEEMDVDHLFDDYVRPENEKQIVPKPPTYEDSLKYILEGNNEVYVDPQYFPEYVDELPPEYDEDEEMNYTLDADDEARDILEDIGIANYDSAQKVLDQPEMTPQKTKNYLSKILKKAKKRKNGLKGYKANVSKDYNKGMTSESEKQIRNKRIDNANVVLNDYIKYYESKVKTIKGSGIRKQRGGDVMFFNDPEKLLKKLEIIIGSKKAGNTSVELRNMGVAILDILLKMSVMNKQQYNKLYKMHFKI